ncbi:hypothetical protein LX76_04736, partial [Cereibacter changlensis]
QLAVVMHNDALCGIITLADILKRVLPAGLEVQKMAAASKVA